MRDRVIPFRQHQFLPALDHGINKSDTVIGPALSTALQRSLKRLERVSKQDKTHGSQATQTMIVDPCLYPLRFGLTKYYSSPVSSFTDCIRLSGKGMSRNLISPRRMEHSMRGTPTRSRMLFRCAIKCFPVISTLKKRLARHGTLSP